MVPVPFSATVGKRTRRLKKEKFLPTGQRTRIDLPRRIEKQDGRKRMAPENADKITVAFSLKTIC
jgi:hypothetical protein